MSRIAIVLALLVTLIGVIPAEASHETAADLTVIEIMDYTTIGWSGFIKNTVAEYNTILPDDVWLSYHGMPEADCADIEPVVMTIAFCSEPDYLPVTTPTGMQAIGVGNTRLWDNELGDWFVRITLSDRPLADARPEYNDNTVCHEMMHALTRGTPDQPGSDQTSCIFGDLTAPGSRDFALLEPIFGPLDTPTNYNPYFPEG